MKNIKKGILPLFFAIIGAFIALWVYAHYFGTPKIVTIKEDQPIQYASLPALPGDLPDLSYAAETSVHAVVHIMVTQKGDYYAANPFYEWFFGDGYRQQEAPQRQGAGSGVIITQDGYIVTNNHVIEDADEIRVILNDKREFTGKLVGADPLTDIALIKIDEKELPHLRFGNSDALKLGQWVLAVGNPFNLTSTVTAGIVSAKGRNIGINPNRMGIEAFIQTDAAVNPGNSGGALVNMQAELVGINTAIASRTGSYTGYSFAVPANIVKKVVADLTEFGEVQRALMGVEISDVTAEIAEKYKLDKIEGVFVGAVNEGGAKDAGIQAEDVIIGIDGVNVNTTAELQEQVGKHRPGDVINVVVKRDNKKKQYNVTLRNKHGNTEIVKKEGDGVFGAQLEVVSDKEKQRLRIRNGIKIIDLNEGKFKDAGIKKGFIITDVNKRPVYEVKDLKYIINNASGGILIEGIYPDGELAYYVFGIK
ncbi:MAG: Do family serine endopeptidase [Prolixibacteraceae bacterium]|nr:Do family serine endopeptidase [Prolixibacteraceae bacterium]